MFSALLFLVAFTVVSGRRVSYVHHDIDNVCALTKAEFYSQCVLTPEDELRRGKEALYEGKPARYFSYIPVTRYSYRVDNVFNLTYWDPFVWGSGSNCPYKCSETRGCGATIGDIAYFGEAQFLSFCPNAIKEFETLSYGVLPSSESGPDTKKAYYVCDKRNDYDIPHALMYFWYNDTDVIIQYNSQDAFNQRNCSVFVTDRNQTYDMGTYFDAYIGQKSGGVRIAGFPLMVFVLMMYLF
jgi:hypothetical protein